MSPPGSLGPAFGIPGPVPERHPALEGEVGGQRRTGVGKDVRQGPPAVSHPVPGGAAAGGGRPHRVTGQPLLRALEGPTWLQLEYQSVRNAQAQTLEVLPYALTLDIFSGGTFLVAWDGHRRIPIHLPLSRIDRAEASQRMAAHPHPELMEHAARYQIGGWTSAAKPFLVEVRIRGSHLVRSLMEAPPPLPDFETFPEEGGKAIRVRFMANDHHGACRWILQFGEDPEALAPPAIREEIARQMRNGMAMYE